MEQLHKFLNRLSIVALVLLVVGLGIAGSFAFKSENLSNIESMVLMDIRARRHSPW